MLATAAMLGFLIAEDLDKYPGWRGGSLIQIDDNRGGVSWDRVAATVTAVAERHRVAILRTDRDFYDGDRLRHVYVVAGDHRSDDVAWARDLLTPFGRSPALRLDIRPFDRGDRLDPRAGYRVLGSKAAATELTTRFEEMGLFGTQTSSLTFEQVALMYVLRSRELVAALLVGLVALAAGSVLLSARRYAVWRLHGASVVRMMWRDVRSLTLFCTITSVVAGVGVSGFLRWYNGWAQFSVFARIAATAAVAMVAIVTLAYGIALLAVCATPVVEALKGRLRLGPVMTLLYPLRILAVLLVVAAVAATVTGYADLANRNAARPYAARVGDAVNLAFPGYRTWETMDRNDAQTGRWLRELDARGRVTVMKRDSLQDHLPPQASPVTEEVLWVNDTFLASQSVLDTAGHRYGPAPENTVRIIIPEHLRPRAEAITASVLKSFTPVNLPAGVPPPHVQQLLAADGQTVFAYATKGQVVDIDGSQMTRPLVHDPVIISIPNGTPLISDIRLAAWANQYGIVLSPEDVTSALGRELPADHLLGMLPITGLLADNHTTAVRRLISNQVVLGLALVVLVLAAVTTCLLYTRKHVRTIYAGHVAGRSFWRIHRRMLLLEILTPIGVLVWICVNNWQRARDLTFYNDLGIPAPPLTPVPDWWRLLPATAAAVVAIAAFATILAVAHRRIITTGLNDT
ncbi:hypothetical protein [Nocardia sp. NPDC051570]|uniref:hypothetical protein n=1 Tax=Nocardia sp. NPDC051570 TaxID=3364324 RepID=UPI00379E4B5B